LTIERRWVVLCDMDPVKPSKWTEQEDALIVSDYIRNRDTVALGTPVNKALTLRTLLPQLNNRSRGSVEFKRCNVSAVLVLLGQPIWKGYLPRDNYQRSLVLVVAKVIGMSEQAATAIIETKTAMREDAAK
jgi:hypothetical protein